jgi:DNA polymerase-3 subunit epsilon
VLAGRVLIAHYAATEQGFVDAACRHCFGGGLLVQTVDTLYLARRSCERQQREPAPGDLRLTALRDRYNLPKYAAHDALVDAIAAAELFLAQVEELSDREALPLKTLLAPG